MLKMIIADDERLIRESLHKLMDWDKYDIEVVATASDGKEALEKTLELNPDILLSDINMPGLSGLDIAKELHDKKSDCMVIFLSAYSEFSYAQKAIQYGVFDYILKPIDESVLLQTVLACAEKIISFKKNNYEIQSANLAQSLLVNDVLCRFYKDPDQIDLAHQNILNEMDFCYNSSTLFVSMLIQISIDELHSLLPSNSKYQNMNFYLLDYAKDESIILWRFFEEQESSCFYYLSCFAEELLLKSGNAFSIYVSSPHTIEDVKKLHPECSFASLASDYGITENYVVFEKMKRQLLLEPLSPTVPKLLPVLTNGDVQEIEKLLQVIFLQLLKTDHFYKLNKTKIHCIAILDELGKIRNPFSLSVDEWESDFMLTLKVPITEAASIAEIYHAMLHILLKLSGKSEKSSSQNRLICKTLNYIHNNYPTASLQNAAAEVYVSSTYLSRVFASEMNESFSRYLVRYRMQKAKELMKNSQYKLYEIAISVGYADISHFSKAFKQIEGCSPQHYRNQQIV